MDSSTDTTLPTIVFMFARSPSNVVSVDESVYAPDAYLNDTFGNTLTMTDNVTAPTIDANLANLKTVVGNVLSVDESIYAPDAYLNDTFGNTLTMTDNVTAPTFDGDLANIKTVVGNVVSVDESIYAPDAYLNDTFGNTITMTNNVTAPTFDGDLASIKTVVGNVMSVDESVYAPDAYLNNTYGNTLTMTDNVTAPTIDADLANVNMVVGNTVLIDENLGINTTSPAEAIHIASQGNILVEGGHVQAVDFIGNLYADDATIHTLSANNANIIIDEVSLGVANVLVYSDEDGLLAPSGVIYDGTNLSINATIFSDEANIQSILTDNMTASTIDANLANIKTVVGNVVSVDESLYAPDAYLNDTFGNTITMTDNVTAPTIDADLANIKIVVGNVVSVDESIYSPDAYLADTYGNTITMTDNVTAPTIDANLANIKTVVGNLVSVDESIYVSSTSSNNDSGPLCVRCNPGPVPVLSTNSCSLTRTSDCIVTTFASLINRFPPIKTSSRTSSFCVVIFCVFVNVLLVNV
jgi:hypothetical protein